MSLIISESASALDCVSPGGDYTYGDSSTISAPTGGTAAPATASLSLSNPNMASSAITPGSTATVSTNVTVSVGDAESYSLTIKVDNTTLKNGSTTIAAGNVVTDNTWGYKWDNASTYTAPSTSNTAVPNLPTLDSNGAASFTKSLTFGAKFGASVESGHYKGSGTLSLVVTPKATIYTLDDLTQLQQLALAPEACANTPYLSGQNYSKEYTLIDVRDNNTYTVRKLGDGKCWLTQNLKLTSQNSFCSNYSRKLNADTSDITEDWIMPISGISGFSDNTASNSYYDSGTDTGYYTWCAATAGTCSSATTAGANATSSICPKGWKLPTGGSGGEYQAFATAEGIANSSADSAKIQGSPYNFAYTGYVNNGTLNFTTTHGYWWSRTAYGGTSAYYLYIDSNVVIPGTTSSPLNAGYAARCVAK